MEKHLRIIFLFSDPVCAYSVQSLFSMENFSLFTIGGPNHDQNGDCTKSIHACLVYIEIPFSMMLVKGGGKRGGGGINGRRHGEVGEGG